MKSLSPVATRLLILARFAVARGQRVSAWLQRLFGGRQDLQSQSAQQRVAMDWVIIERHWKQFNGKVQAHWGRLSVDHLDVIAGSRDALAGTLQDIYGICSDQAERQISDFQRLTTGHPPKLMHWSVQAVRGNAPTH